MRYNTVIFDLDGTLLDTVGDLADAVNHALRLHNLPVRTDDEIRRFVGNGVRNLMMKSVYGEEYSNITAYNDPIGVNDFESALSDFRDYYNSHMTARTRPYKGITELLKKIKKNGFNVAVVSNKYDGAVKELCRYYFDDMIDVAVGSTDDIPRKPEPDMVYRAIEQLPGDIKAVYIGDSEVDVKTAKNTGLTCISCLWGFRSREQLLEAGADIFAENPDELWGLITG